jgi:hypothetical protein
MYQLVTQGPENLVKFMPRLDLIIIVVKGILYTYTFMIHLSPFSAHAGYPPQQPNHHHITPK